MDWEGKVVAVTGGARGIGRALAEAALKRGAKVAICDLDGGQAVETAKAIGAVGAGVDVSDEAAVAAWITRTEGRLGPIDAYFSNAGVAGGDGPQFGAATAPNAAWEKAWQVNVMSSVYAARHLVPLMIQRGGGVFVVTASAAGYLNAIGDSAYSATKHAAVSFAESLAINHGDDGLQVACICPEGVKTAMTKGLENSAMAMSGFIEAVDVAEAAFTALAEKRFCVFTHASTGEYAAARVTAQDQWLGGMRKIRRGLIEATGRPF